MQPEQLVGVDHGNAQVKTRNHVFRSGMDIRSGRPPAGADTIHYKGKFYTLTNERADFKWDKSEDETFFVLTLFAIAKETLHRKIFQAGIPMHINLAVCLPIQDFSTQYERFEQYFKSKGPVIDFIYNTQPMKITLDSVDCFAQTVTGVMPYLKHIEMFESVMVCDIGGMHMNYCLLREGSPDLSVSGSLELGMVPFYHDLLSYMRGKTGNLFTEEIVNKIWAEDMVAHPFGDSTIAGIPDSVKQHVKQQAENNLQHKISRLRESQIDLSVTPSLWMGGGAIALQRYIRNNQKLISPQVVTNVHANAIGCEMAYQLISG